MSITDLEIKTAKETNVFPSFKKLSIDDKDLITDICSQFNPYSDFNLISLMTWDTNNSNSYSILGDLLIIKIKDYLNDSYIYSLVGKTINQEIIDKIKPLCTNLSLVPEEVAMELKKYKTEILESRDDFDYVINTEALSKSQGGTYKNIRRHIKDFQQNYPHYQISKIDFNNTKDKEKVLNLTKTWATSKNFDDKKISEDLSSIQKFIDLSKNFNTLSFALFIENEMVAFNNNELLSNGWAMGHFGKSLTEFQNSSLFLEYETSKWLFNNGYKYINIQQDTGLPGLREQKMILHPEFFLKKYTVNFL